MPVANEVQGESPVELGQSRAPSPATRIALRRRAEIRTRFKWAVPLVTPLHEIPEVLRRMTPFSPTATKARRQSHTPQPF